MIPVLAPGDPFPPVSRALREPNGLLCAGGDLAPETLVAAYSRGIFPWFGPGSPTLWWSPDPRMVLFPDEFRTSRSLAKTLRRRAFDVRMDTAFPQVVAACAAPRDGQDGTWIVPAIQAAYTRLHALGFAHSVESWQGGELVGGLYGVHLGHVFFGESMFARQTDASKVALAHLASHVRGLGVRVIDCQQATRHLASFGAREIPRADFTRLLGESIQYPPTGSRWIARETEWPGSTTSR